MNGSGPPFYGKFRGKVEDNGDPDKRGRLRLKVSDIYGEEASPSWAMPALPYAGKGVGLFLIPPKGASVWVEFEQGDPDHPIWSGCFWEENEELPASPAVPEMKVLKTDTATITLNDKSGDSGVTIETTAGMKIKIDANGIEINNGQASIKLSGSQVSINNGALEVM